MARGIRRIESENEDSEDNVDKENEPPLAMPPDDAAAEELRDVSITLYDVSLYEIYLLHLIHRFYRLLSFVNKNFTMKISVRNGKSSPLKKIRSSGDEEHKPVSMITK